MTTSSLRLLADENVSAAAVRGLRSAGYDTSWIREIRRGMPDGEVLALAEAEQRVLVTSDKDFGELVFSDGLDAPGVILLRAGRTNSAEQATLLLHALATETPWMGHFVVVEDGRIRSTRIGHPHP